MDRSSTDQMNAHAKNCLNSLKSFKQSVVGKQLEDKREGDRFHHHLRAPKEATLSLISNLLYDDNQAHVVRMIFNIMDT